MQFLGYIAHFFRGDSSMKQIMLGLFMACTWFLAGPGNRCWGGESLEVLKLLNESMDLEAFQNPMTLKESLGLFYEKFAAKGKELPILVDTDAFKRFNPDCPDIPDIYDTQIQFPP